MALRTENKTLQATLGRFFIVINQKYSSMSISSQFLIALLCIYTELYEKQTIIETLKVLQMRMKMRIHYPWNSKISSIQSIYDQKQIR